jgi:hypothetical protein
MGLQFLDMDDAVKRRFEELYEEALHAAAGIGAPRRGTFE